MEEGVSEETPTLAASGVLGYSEELPNPGRRAAGLRGLGGASQVEDGELLVLSELPPAAVRKT